MTASGGTADATPAGHAASGAAVPRRIGVHGGTFNPPHRAHLALARAAADELDLDLVLLVPAGEPPHKAVEHDPGADVRLALCRAAVADAGDPRLAVSDVEVRRDGPSYTADTLATLAAEHPDAELVLLLGADAAASLREWHAPADVLARASVGVAGRPGTEATAVREAFAALGAEDRLRPFSLTPQDVSSSAVRRLIADGRPYAGLLTPGVAAAVARHGLYGGRPEGAEASLAAPTSTVNHVARARQAPEELEDDEDAGDVHLPGRSPEDDAALAELVASAATHAADRKAADLEAIDLREVSPYADAFLLCTGNTERQVKAIHDAVLEGLRSERGLRPRSVEGLPEARWILMDYGDVIVHVQVPEARDFYRLSRLWGDRPRIALPQIAGDGGAGVV